MIRLNGKKAADAAKAVIDLNLYSLYPDYKKSYTDEAIYNSEIIWERLYNAKLNPEISIEQSYMPNGYHGYGQVPSFTERG